MLLRPTEIEVVEFRPEGNVLALESSSRRLLIEVDVAERSRSLRPTPGAIAAGEVGAEDVESCRKSPVVGAARFMDEATRVPSEEARLSAGPSLVHVRCGVERTELAFEGLP